MTDATPLEGELILDRTADDAVRVEVLWQPVGLDQVACEKWEDGSFPPYFCTHGTTIDGQLQASPRRDPRPVVALRRHAFAAAWLPAGPVMIRRIREDLRKRCPVLYPEPLAGRERLS